MEKPQQTVWSSPAIFVPKTDEALMFSVDYNKLKYVLLCNSTAENYRTNRSLGKCTVVFNLGSKQQVMSKLGGSLRL